MLLQVMYSQVLGDIQSDTQVTALLQEWRNIYQI